MPAIPVLAVQVEHEPRQLLLGAVLMLGTAVIQTFGLVMMVELMERIREAVVRETTRTRMLAALCSMVVYFFALHLLEMCLWAAFYEPLAGYSSFAVALYESALAFTTMNTAKLPAAWKFLSAAEGVTGLLMFAWSTSAIFSQTAWITEARRNYLHQHPRNASRESAGPPAG